jgi:putative methionine-R-sulfoxide reductase with GAF domain
VVTVLVLVMAVASYLQLRQVRPSSEEIIHNSTDLDHLQRLAAATAALDADLERYLVIRGAEYRESVQNDLLVMVDVLKLLQETPAMGARPEYGELGEVITRLQASVQRVMDAQAANASTGETNRQIVAVYDDIETLKTLQEDLSATTLAGLQATAQDQSVLAGNVLTQSMLLGIIVVLVAMATAYVTDRRLRAISNLTNTATAIAAGDLERTAPVESNDEIGKLAVAFNTMTGQLRELVVSLEQRVADRTRALKLSAEVSRRLSTILEPSQLVAQVVQSLQETFNYYHVHIYLFDESNENLVMVGGSGEAGQQMLARGHKIPAGKGLVGRAAQTGTAVLVADTSKEPDWLPNPLLPETKSEIAVPIIVGDEILGALDVQQNIIDGLGQEDMELLFGVASQVAIALRNARQFSEAQRRSHRETLSTQITQQIQSTRTVESALQVAARELGRVVHASRTRVRVNLSENGKN